MPAAQTCAVGWSGERSERTLCVGPCRTCSTAWGWKSLDNLMEVKSSEAQGQNREGLSEGSVEQRRDPTNRNRIGGRTGGTSGQVTAKSISIKDRSCKSGGDATTAVEPTPRGLHRGPRGLGTLRGVLTPMQKSAEGIVGARATSRMTGGLTGAPKAQTVPTKGLKERVTRPDIS